MKNLTTLTALTVSLLAIPAMADAPKGYLTVPGTDTAIQVYGRATFDLVHDFVQPGGVLTGLSAADASVADDTRAKNVWDQTICMSRFGLRTTTPSEFGDIKTRFEMDFLGTNKDSAGSPHSGEVKNYAHVRQMFGTIGHWTFGKTDSIFMDPDGSPNYIDQDGLLADCYGVGRISMVKFSTALGEKAELNLAFEQDSLLGISGKLTGDTASPSAYTYTTKNEWPGALVGRVSYGDKWGHVNFSGAFQRYSTFVNQADGTTAKYGKTTFSFLVSGTFQFGEDSLVWQAGQGNGQYGAGLQDGVKLVKDQTKVIDSRQALLGYEHFWTAKVHSNLFGSIVSYQKDDELGMNGSAFHTYTQIGANTIWNPTRTVQLAVEYIWGAAKTFDADTITKADGGKTDSVHESKLHFQARFNFN
jgi:hypothetical protein